MKNKNYYAVIMAGGIGSRFWPMSRRDFPKQFHDVLGTGQSLLQKTYSRLNQTIPSENIFVLTHERYLELTLSQLPEITKKQVVLEPAMRNTAPCILMSALKIHKKNPDGLMLVAPSDHWIEDENVYSEAVKKCFQAVSESEILMTLGITPTFPNTGYGYIESSDKNENDIKKVKQFREKPDYETAKSFLESGNFLWNAGIFIWSTKSILSAFETHLPQMYQLFSKGNEVFNTEKEADFVSENYPKAENISIDYGILEKAENVFVKKADFDWNDLGTWGSLYEKSEKDEQQNAVINAQKIFRNASDNMVLTLKKKLVVLEDLQDYIVVDTEDVLLVFPKEKEQDIKILLEEVKSKFDDKYS